MRVPRSLFLILPLLFLGHAAFAQTYPEITYTPEIDCSDAAFGEYMKCFWCKTFATPCTYKRKAPAPTPPKKPKMADMADGLTQALLQASGINLPDVAVYASAASGVPLDTSQVGPTILGYSANYTLMYLDSVGIPVTSPNPSPTCAIQDPYHNCVYGMGCTIDPDTQFYQCSDGTSNALPSCYVDQSWNVQCYQNTHADGTVCDIYGQCNLSASCGNDNNAQMNCSGAWAGCSYYGSGGTCGPVDPPPPPPQSCNYDAYNNCSAPPDGCWWSGFGTYDCGGN